MIDENKKLLGLEIIACNKKICRHVIIIFDTLKYSN